MPKNNIKITYADGSTMVVGPGYFQKVRGKPPRKKTKEEREHWKHIRWAAQARDGYRCAECGRKGPLEVHHLTYERRYKELLGDVICLCRRCHNAKHRPAHRRKKRKRK